MRDIIWTTEVIITALVFICSESPLKFCLVLALTLRNQSDRLTAVRLWKVANFSFVMDRLNLYSALISFPEFVVSFTVKMGITI